MHIKIQTSPLASGNTGSCKQLVNYLQKEDKKAIDQGKYEEVRFFFSETNSMVFHDEVVKSIDENGKGGLRNDEAKFYSLVIAPSEKELKHIGNDAEKLQAYTKAVMQTYAENFNKGLDSSDLVWYAKIEQKRHYKGFDVIPEGMKQGDEKEGLQSHIHVIVSRKTTEGKKISPLAKQRGTEITTGTGQKVTAGFDREKFADKCEKIFDEKFSYQRLITEKFAYHKSSELEKTQMEKQFNFEMYHEQTKMLKQKQLQEEIKNSQKI